MQGEPHPNKGKSLPQTAAKSPAASGKICITNGSINKWWPPEDDVPEGWYHGQTRYNKYTLTAKSVEARRATSANNSTRHKEKYYEQPKHCAECGTMLEFHQRHHKTCSEECRSSDRSKTSKRINALRKEWL